MQNLQQLICAGFNHGRDDAPGMDRTVSGLEWAYANLGSSGTALAYAADAADALESRLIAAYVIQTLTHLRSGDRDAALSAYAKARGLQKLANHASAPGAAKHDPIEATLAELGRRFEQQYARAA